MDRTAAAASRRAWVRSTISEAAIASRRSVCRSSSQTQVLTRAAAFSWAVIGLSFRQGAGAGAHHRGRDFHSDTEHLIIRWINRQNGCVGGERRQTFPQAVDLPQQRPHVGGGTVPV